MGTIEHPHRRAVATAIAVLAMLTGSLWFVAVAVLHDRVLDEGTYVRVLTESDATRRVYREVLADEATRGVFGGLDALGVDSGDASAAVSAALRLALPPDVLEAAVDALVTGVVSYARGDRDRLEAPLDLIATLERGDPATAAVLVALVRAAPALALAHLDEIEAYGRTLADGIAAGRLPATVPLIGGREVRVGDVVAALDAVLPTGVSPAVRADVAAAVASPAHRDELLTAAFTRLRASLRDASVHVAAGGDVEVDLVDALLLASHQDRATIEGHVRPVRRIAAWMPSASRVAGLVAAVGGAAALLVLHRRRPARAAIAAGASLAAAGTACWVAWLAIARALGPAPVGAHLPSGELLPIAVRQLVADVDRHLLAAAADAWLRPALALLGGGTIVVLGGVVPALAPLLAAGRRRRLAGAFAVAMLATVGLVVAPPPGEAAAERRCNGHAELCARPYDEVVQLAAHNAMSSPDVVRVWPEHDGNIGAQLRFGVRALMIDAAYWDELDGAALAPVRRVVASGRGLGGLGDLDELVEAAIAPRPGIYLCHSQCALGAIRFADALAEVKAFLDERPDEVVTLIIQDAVEPADVADALREVGLDAMLYAREPDRGWPTLGELIDSGRRLVVFSEQHDVAAPWYLSAFQHIQDTPYGARTAEALSCAPHRGPRDASLFLMNHWITRQVPDRAAAAVVNATAFVLARARRCAEERGMLPNFVAVSFYDIGGAMGAVDELNRRGG